jgi:predicted metal-dependent peptidase
MAQVKEAQAFDNGRDSKGKKWEDYDTIKCPNGEVIDMQKLLEEQQRACAALGHLLPALGGFVSKLRFVYTFRVDTQATDGYNVFVNPQFTSHLDLTGKTFVLAHEIMHCLLNHLRRGNELGHDPEKSNVAADYEVNITLAEDLKLIKASSIKSMGALIDSKYHTWGYEKIYADNPSRNSNSSMNNKKQSTQAQQNQGQGGSDGDSGNQQLDPDYIKGWNDAVKDYMDGKLSIN